LPLQVRQPIDLLIQRDPPIDFVELTRIRQVGRRICRVTLAIAPVVRERVGGDPVEPRRQRHAPPFEAAQRAECLLEHLGRDVFCDRPIPGPPADVRMDTIDVPLVNVDKSSGIGLCRLEQEPIVLGGVCQSGPRVSILITCWDDGKLWAWAEVIMSAFRNVRLQWKEAMAPDTLKVVIDCEGEAIDELRTALNAGHTAQFIERRNLSGDAATWIVVATLAVQSISPLLTFLAQWRGLTRVKRIKVGDIEIENPSEDDLALLRARMRAAIP
jgi:hypothetical protein